MRNIILDRDGVINIESEQYIKTPDEWHAIPGSLEAICKLNQQGCHVYIATNQSGIARALYDIPTLTRIHTKMLQALSALGGHISGIFFCPHHPDDHCQCRKPQPGMLHQISAQHAVDLSETYFIGDSISDVQAGRRAGCPTALVLTGKGQKARHHPDIKGSLIFDDLSHAVTALLENRP